MRTAPSATRNSFLSLSQTCKQINDEFLSWLQESTTIAIDPAELNSYLRTFHPPNKPRAKHPVKLRLMLPRNESKAWRYVSYTDLTHLHTLLSQHTNFQVSVARCDPQHAYETVGVLSRVPQALEAALSRLASIPLPVLDGILAVRIIILPVKSYAKPVLWLVLKQHTVLTGEWPWYGAQDLHEESVAQWQQWQRENGLEEVKGWQVHVMVKQSLRDVPGYMLLPGSEEGYMAMPEREALQEGEWEGREWERETLRVSVEGGGRWDWAGWERACQARARDLRIAQARLTEEEVLRIEFNADF